jgi:hypothetical protein
MMKVVRSEPELGSQGPGPKARAANELMNMHDVMHIHELMNINEMMS